MMAAAALAAAAQAKESAPVALLHGVNGSCGQVQSWVDMIAESIDHEAVVKCVEVGDGETTSMFEQMKWQAATVCHKLHNDPDFDGKEINLIGISQGGLIARTVVERCSDLQIDTLYTFGGPHNGVSVYRKCVKWWCPFANHILGYLAEFAIV